MELCVINQNIYKSESIDLNITMELTKQDIKELIFRTGVLAGTLNMAKADIGGSIVDKVLAAIAKGEEIKYID